MKASLVAISTSFLTSSLLISAASANPPQTLYSITTPQIVPETLGQRFQRTGSFVGREASTQLSLADVMKNIGEPEMLSQWKLWRAALRGEGEIANHDFWLLPSPKEPQAGTKLRIGARPQMSFALANMNAGPGVQISASGFSAGSTAPLGMLNQALQPVDKWLSPDEETSADDSQLTWLSAPQFQTGNFKLQTAMLMGRRDLTPDSSDDSAFSRGTLWGTKAEWSFAPRWNLRSEWMSSRSDEQSGAAWRAELNGPIVHPWGEARFSAQMTDASSDFSPFTGGVAAGERKSDVHLAQNVVLGMVSGTLGASWNQTQRDSGGAHQALEGRANFDLKLSEMLSLSSQHRARRHVSSTQEQLETSNNLGVKLKLTKAVDVTLGAGQSRWASTQLASERAENKLLVGLSMQTGEGWWHLNMERNLSQQTSTLEKRNMRLEGEQPIFDWLKVRGSWRLSNQMSDDIFQYADADRMAEAELALRSLGSLTLRVKDWQQNQSAADAASRELGVRYAYGESRGFGLTFEYSQREQTSQNDQKEWRIGVTYR